MSFTAEDLWCALSGDQQMLLEHLCDPSSDPLAKALMRDSWPNVTKELQRHSWGALLDVNGYPTDLGLAVVKESPSVMG